MHRTQLISLATGAVGTPLSHHMHGIDVIRGYGNMDKSVIEATWRLIDIRHVNSSIAMCRLIFTLTCRNFFDQMVTSTKTNTNVSCTHAHMHKGAKVIPAKEISVIKIYHIEHVSS